MADRRHQTYVHGSAARKLYALPDNEPYKRELHTVKPARRKENYLKIKVINALYICMMIVALVCVFFSCVTYLELQAQVSEKAANVANLETKYVELKTKNDITEVDVSSSINYDYILDVAINELGMVYATQDQVVEYNSEEIQYVKQYMDIPQ